MATPEQRENENNPYLMMIRYNQWHNSDRYRNCTIEIIEEHHYKLLYGTKNSYAAWVEVLRKNDNWYYYPLGNKDYESAPYAWLGDLFDDAQEAMIKSKM